ncbi:hypothetical protein C8J23_1289 [Shewanella chilikensis]|uniref:Transposase n=1 Tax=Shewanella chilikensis TaxID=558541 RepID=A0ABX5PKA3_9GAMM|nr:hypothetical protein C8J23_1289 [Shewanella chilikensis]
MAEFCGKEMTVATLTERHKVIKDYSLLGP